MLLIFHPADKQGVSTRQYRPRMSARWVAYEAVLCCLMVAAVAVFYAYAVRLSVREEFFPRFNVYDADTFAPARYFLLKRQAPTTATALAETNTTANSTVAAPAAGSPGGGMRWQLPPDQDPINGAGSMFARLDSMYGTVVWYTFLQGLVLALLIVRWLHYLAFQPRLSLIWGTLALALPDLAHLAVVVVLVVVLFGAAACIGFGAMVERLSDYGSGLYVMLRYVLLGDDGGVFNVRAYTCRLLRNCNLTAQQCVSACNSCNLRASKRTVILTPSNILKAAPMVANWPWPCCASWVADTLSPCIPFAPPSQSLIATSVIRTGGEWALAWLLYLVAPIFFLFVLLSFLLALLLWPFFELKYGVAGQPGIPHDLGRIVRWTWQRFRHGAPKNKQLLRWFEVGASLQKISGRSFVQCEASAFSWLCPQA